MKKRSFDKFFFFCLFFNDEKFKSGKLQLAKKKKFNSLSI